MNKYTLNETGVKQWLKQLYSATIGYQMMEQELILRCLISWLVSRFELTESQIAYLRSLSEDFRNNLAQEIVATINNRADITLNKQTDENTTAVLARDSVKVTEYESKRAASDAPLPPDDPVMDPQINSFEGNLIVRIYYRPI